MLSILLAATLAQAPVEGLWLVTTKRQGVSARSAAELITTVEGRLSAFPKAAPTGDLSACKGKLPCLLSAAKKQHAAFLVTFEAARVVEQLIVKVSLLDVEEDGRTVATKLLEGPATTVATELGPAVDAALSPALKLRYRTPEVAVTPPPPPPEPVAPKPTEVIAPVPAPVPAPAAVVVTVPPPAGPSGVRVTGLVMGAVGVAGLAASAVLGGMTLDAVARRDQACPPGQQCNDPIALGLHDRAATTQDVGIVVAAAAGALLITGTVLFIAGAPAQPRVALVPGPQGATVFVSASF